MWSCSGSDSDAEGSENLVSIDIEETLRISDEHADEFLFGRLSGIVVDSEGHILAGDQSMKTIYHFSPEGLYIGNFGQEGAGPGEFGQYFNLGISDDDSLYVQDMMQSRVQTFGKNSEGSWVFGSTIPLRRGEGGFPSNLNKISDTEFIVHYMRGVQSGNSAEKPFLQMANRDGEMVGEKILELEPFQMHVIRSENRVMAISIPHTYHQPYAISSSGHIYSGYSENFLISKFDHQGNHLLDIDFPVEPLELTREEKDEAVSNFGEAAGEVRSRIPDIKPAFTRLLVADTGDLWVHRGKVTDDQVWFVFSGMGKPLYEVKLPLKYNVSQVRLGNIYGTLTDDDELVKIVVYRYISDDSAEGYASDIR
ncbi:MAG: 6-bladed beta-propeller [Cyclonatronaceae bacterium]